MSDWEEFIRHVQALDRWAYMRAVIGGYIMGKEATKLGIEYFKLMASNDAVMEHSDD